MRPSLVLPAFALALAALPAAAANDIFRCATAAGITYQQMPCPDASVAQRANVPTDFPAPNLEERNRLFEREAALYRRLEARRDREMQELVLRDAAAERSLERERLAALAAQAAQQQPVYLVRLPGRRVMSGTRRTRPTS